MEEVRGFTGGLNTDVTPLQQPKETYRNAVNFVQLAKDGNIYALTNEEGTVLTSTSFPTDFKVIGHVVLDNEVFVALAHDSGYSQIGVIDEMGDYTRVVPSPEETDLDANTNSELGLTLSRPVDMQARKRLAGERLIYFCDGVGGRPLGFINADNPPVIGEIEDNTKVIPNLNLPQIDLQEIQEISGNLRVGIYHFIPRYYTQDLTPTTFGIPSGGIPIVEDYTTVGRDKYDGEYPDFGAVNKAIRIQLSNLDTSFPFLEISVVRYENITNTLTIEALPLINITGDTVTYSYSGNETELTPLTQEEVNQIPISYNSAKCVIQKDNYLFWSNLGDNSNKFDDDFQRFANSITINYKINEIEYRPSSETLNPSGFNIIGDPYISNTASPTEEIYIQFSEPLNFTESNDVTNFTFYDAGGVANGIVQIDDGTKFFNLGVGDTIVIDDNNGTVETYTAVEGVPAAFEFDVTSQDNITIATNLVNSINANSTIAEAGNGVNNDSNQVGVAANIVGVAGNAYTIAYNDLSGTGNGVTLYEGDGVTTGNPVSLTGGVAPNSFTPNEVRLPEPTDLTLLALYFDPVQFGGGGIPGGGTLDVTVTTGAGESFSAFGVDVINTAADGSINVETLGEFTDYKSEFLTYYAKTFMRDEVYSFGFVANFKDGAPSFNYHIPGNDKATLTTTDAIPDTPGVYDSETEGLLGTYVSTDNDYPTKQFYPGTTVGEDDTACYSAPQNAIIAPANRQVRHHKMPSLVQEPHFRLASDGRTFIRLISLEFTFNEALSADIVSQLQSITITRERRDSPQNKSIFAQGLVSRYYNVYSDYPYKWESGFAGIDVEKGAFNPVWRKMPFFNCTQIENIQTDENSGSLINIGSGGTFPSIAFEPKNTGAPGESLDVEAFLYANNQRMAFFSPDSQLGDLNPNNVNGTFLTPALKLKASTSGGRFFTTSYNVEDSNTIGGFGSSNTSLAKYIQCWIYANFIEEDTSITLGTPPQITAAQYIAKGSRVQLADLDDVIDNSVSSRHLYLKTSDAPEFGLDGDIEIEFEAEMDGTASGIFFDEDQYENKDRLKYNGDLTNHLFNLKSENTGQYGSPSGAVYIPIATSRDLPSSPGTVLSGVYGGDTFITKFSYRNNDVIPYKGFSSDSSGGPVVGIDTGKGYTRINASQHDDSPIEGMNFKAIGYFFVESTVNAEYRHQYIDRSDPNNEQAEASYFPNVDIEEALKVQSQVGDSRGYNLQYSFENDIRTYSNKSIAQVTVGVFENRTIYSNKALEDELEDSYRIYQQNSFYDMPKHTGPIWDTFVYNNNLYLHTTKSLWRSYVNNVTQQATSVGQVVLGTGDLFSIPAQQMIVTTGGYAGTISQWGGILTPYAYYFPDVLQGKVFMLQGDQLREISQDGLKQFFSNTLTNELYVNGTIYDNPFTDKGMMGVFDFEKQRTLFSKVGTTDNFTISFSNLSNKWISFHTYVSNLYYSLNDKVFALLNNTSIQRFEHNVGDYGVFYNQSPAESKLTLVFNQAAGIEKVWDNMKMHTVSRNLVDNVIEQFDSWNQLRIYSDTRNTGWRDLIVTNAYGSKAVDDPTNQVRVRRNNNKFNLTVPSDIVVDDGQDIFDVANQDRLRLFKPRIKGDHITADFVYTNANNYEFIVNFIGTEFRQNAS